MSCPCGADHATDAPGSVYWVSVIDGPRQALVAGPYQTHGEALGDVEDVRAVALQHDGRTHFYAWGTARSDAEPSRPAGRLNEALAAFRVARAATEATIANNKIRFPLRKNTRRAGVS